MRTHNFSLPLWSHAVGGCAGPHCANRDSKGGGPRDYKGQQPGNGIPHRLRQDAGLPAAAGALATAPTTVTPDHWSTWRPAARLQVHIVRASEVATGELSRAKRPRAIILEPARELSVQVLAVAKSVTHHCRFSVTGLCGGDKCACLDIQQPLLRCSADLLLSTRPECRTRRRR